MYKKIEKIVITDKSGKVTILLFQEPISFPVYYAYKSLLRNQKNYGTARPIFQVK
jgi:hypothetical protein